MQKQPIQIRRGIFQGAFLRLLYSTYSVKKRAEQR
jgi:hypothetical protein